MKRMQESPLHSTHLQQKVLGGDQVLAAEGVQLLAAAAPQRMLTRPGRPAKASCCLPCILLLNFPSEFCSTSRTITEVRSLLSPPFYLYFPVSCITSAVSAEWMQYTCCSAHHRGGVRGAVCRMDAQQLPPALARASHERGIGHFWCGLWQSARGDGQAAHHYWSCSCRITLHACRVVPSHQMRFRRVLTQHRSEAPFLHENIDAEKKSMARRNSVCKGSLTGRSHSPGCTRRPLGPQPTRKERPMRRPASTMHRSAPKDGCLEPSNAAAVSSESASSATGCLSIVGPATRQRPTCQKANKAMVMLTQRKSCSHPQNPCI